MVLGCISLMAIIFIAISGCKSPRTPEKIITMKKTLADTAVEPEKTDVAPVTGKAAGIPLTVTIKNLASSSAPVVIGVYGTKNKFPDPKDQLKEYKFKPHGMALTAKITDLPFGTYAIATYQDVKSTGKISKNFIGIPTDPYGFSNNYKPTIKAPGFKDCSFEYTAKTNSLAITMIK